MKNRVNKRGKASKRIIRFVIAVGLIFCGTLSSAGTDSVELETGFRNPPDSARPGVYWYFMDGNQDRDEMVADLESMVKVGIGSVLFLEVNIGMPVGPVPFMSEQWQDHVVHAFKTADRLGMEVILGTGPGWAGSGGSWVKPEDSMQHLVGNSTQVHGPTLFEQKLPLPPPHPPNHFAGMSGALAAIRNQWYSDVAVLAFPTPKIQIGRFDDYNIKTLKDVRPYSIMKDAQRFVMPHAEYPLLNKGSVIDADRIIDLTSLMKDDGTLRWDVPEGDWTIMRFVSRSTGQTTRPAPRAGHGFECDKFNGEAYRRHWDNFQGRLLKKLGPLKPGRGLTTIHLDSWEMSSQNWSAAFRQEFEKRRGYDPQPFYPAYMGMVVGDLERTERFLWDLRKTAQELVLENHAGIIKKIAHQHGLLYANEPYDMNPAGDIDLGSVADIPACEFWNIAGGPDSQYSCIEAVSIAHIMGRPRVNAEAFTTAGMQYLNYPGNMKNQTDWAFAMGINGLIFHTFQHQPLGKKAKPGMTMGPYGVQWNRNRTMWHLFSGYHQYIARCSHLLRQGEAVADVLYLTPEGAPQIFLAPESALEGAARVKDKKGYNFDAVSPRILNMRAKSEEGRIAFSGGSKYSLLVLPDVETMTPETLTTITKLVKDGATVIGSPPRKSPSLVGYPACDKQVQELASELWGKKPRPERQVGKGRILLSPSARSGTARKPLLPDSGNWIWLDKDSPERSAAVGAVHFRKLFQVADLEQLSSAVIEATADNSFTLNVNGRTMLQGDSFNEIKSANLLSGLRTGKNTVTVVANNSGDTPNPAGLIVAMRLTYANGDHRIISSDETWQAGTDGANWSAAKSLGRGTMAPWRIKASKPGIGLYPEYATTASVLAEMGIPEDFQSDGPIRYGHRRTDAEEIYFIANTTDQKVETTCQFRVRNSAPELWDPMTGEIKALPNFTLQDKTTSVPMVFEAYQSFFVVFPRKEKSVTKPVAGATNFRKQKPVATLEGAWEVSFDPAWGGPEKIAFDKLEDWTSREERGVKYYSGAAVYRKTFDRPAALDAGAKLYLDLGEVHDMCRVRLNGQDLGILWSAPWRVDITDAVRNKGNQLQIEVINRWVNRLIGDQQPGDKNVRTLSWPSGMLAGKSYQAGRYTYTTYNPYKADSELLPSGLLGPVRLLFAEE